MLSHFGRVNVLIILFTIVGREPTGKPGAK